MTAKSFSIAVTVPLTTLPSKASSSERVSFNRAAKSSRVGVKSFASLVAVLILLLLRSCRAHAPGAAAHPNAKRHRCLEQRLPHTQHVRCLPSKDHVPTRLPLTLGAPTLANLPCNHSDGHLECRFYIQIAGIQQDRVAGWPHRGRLASRVAFVAALDV